MPDAPLLSDPALDAKLKLDDLVDRDALGELCKSFFALFGIPVRIYSVDGILLADASSQHEVCDYVNTLLSGRSACGATVSAVKSTEPGEASDVTHPCFTGAVYRIVSIDYEARKIGRVIIGPYLPTTVVEVPETFLSLDPDLDVERARTLLAKVPRAKVETVARIAKHLKSALDLILFSGHKAWITNHMHLASVRESYRELEEKNTNLQEAYDRLKELDRLKSNFLATVSHELRTPLTSIIGYSEMLSEGIAGSLAGEQLEFVQTIHEKGEQLLELITSLLDLSKLESGTMTIRKTQIHITSVLSEVISTLAPNARKKGIELKSRFEPALCPMRGDPERLRQIFINLVDNAVKFTPKDGSVTLFARTISAEQDSDTAGFALLAPMKQYLEVRVIDTGIGIPENERARVFDPFYQVDSSSTREYGGTGLGLSIVKRLVEGHSGTISVEGNNPRGAVFVVRFPSAGSIPMLEAAKLNR